MSGAAIHDALDAGMARRAEGHEFVARPRSVRLLRLLSFLAACLVAFSSARAAGEQAAFFDAANKLYEQGQYAAAATAYEKLIESGTRSEALYFNLGNAWFKAGQVGRAIAAWREVERFSPRDPNVLFNIEFARKRVSGSSPTAGSLWQRAFRALTLNEWTALASVLLWIWLLLLAIREARPALRRTLSGYTATAGLGAFLLAGCLAAAASLQFMVKSAVVIVPEAIARSGPLDEAKVLHQLRDGTEVTVIDQKEVAVADLKQAWIQVRDPAGRTGWMKSDQVLRLPR